MKLGGIRNESWWANYNHTRHARLIIIIMNEWIMHTCIGEHVHTQFLTPIAHLARP